MSSGRWLRAVALALLTVVLGLAVITARAVSDGEEHMRQSDAAFNQGNLPDALLHARSAAVMYAPGAPHLARAYDRMIAIAIGSEAAGHARSAESAWRAVRGAALETRHVWVPHAAELARANENLARLENAANRSDKAEDPRAAVERARQELARDDAPSTPWLIALLAGFAAMLTGLVVVGLRGISPDGKLALGRAKLGIVLSIAGALSWTAAVWRA